jgi:hypothetical protein
MAGVPLATAFVRVRPQIDQSAFKRDTERAVSGTGKTGATAGKKFSSGFLKIATSAFALAGGLQLFKGFISDATESQKVAAQTAAVIKSTGGAANVTAGQVSKLATAMENKLAIDDETIKSGANMLLTFTNIRNESGKNNKIFDQATGVLTDMTAAMNGGAVTSEAMRSQAIQLGKALNDPVKGLTALRRVGVSFTDQQEKQITALVKSGKTMQAQKIILHELGKEFGGSAAAAVTPAKRLQTQFGELSEQIGSALLPVIAKVSSFLLKSVVPALKDMFAFVSRNSDVIGTLAKILLPLAGTIFLIVKAVKIWTAVQAALDVVLDANPIGLVIAAVAALIAIIIIAWKKSDTFRKIVTAAWEGIKDAAETVVRWFTHDFVPFFTKTIPAAFKTVLDWVKRNWPWLLGALTGPIGLAVVWIIRHWSSILDGIKNVWESVTSWLKGLPGRIVSAIGSLAKLLWTKGRDLIGGLFGGALDMMRGVGRWVANIGGKILDAVKSFFGIHSPSSVFFGLGTNLIKGLFQGMVHGAAGLASWVLGKLGGILGGIGGFFTGGGTGSPGKMAGTYQAYAASILPSFGWSPREMQSLIPLWNSESGWNPNAQNPTSTAYGIAQFLDSTWAGFRYPKTSNGYKQIFDGLQYIKQRYGDPAGAWAFHRAHNWYGKGGWITEPIAGIGLRSGQSYGFGEHGREYVTPGGGMATGRTETLLRTLIAEVRNVAGAVDGNAADTAAGVAAALSGPARHAAFRAEWSPR